MFWVGALVKMIADGSPDIPYGAKGFVVRETDIEGYAEVKFFDHPLPLQVPSKYLQAAEPVGYKSHFCPGPIHKRLENLRAALWTGERPDTHEMYNAIRDACRFLTSLDELKDA